jgi:hypothetical protein
MRTLLVSLCVLLTFSCKHNTTPYPETRSRFFLSGKILNFTKINDSLGRAEISVISKAKTTIYKNILIEVFCISAKGDTLSKDGALTHQTIEPKQKLRINADFIISPATHHLDIDCISGTAFTKPK